MILFRNKNHLFIILGWFLFQTTLLSQEPVTVERSNNKVIIEGTVYYIHVVKPGHTLYSIARAYNISQKEIAIENPGVMSGLQLGQALKIPVAPTMDKDIDTSPVEEAEVGGRNHLVRQGETLYGIARLYGLEPRRLMEANRGLDGDNLQPGMRLVIPEKEGSDQEPAYNEEGIAYHKVKRRETLFSIAKFYGISVQEIRVANPELGWGGPKSGQLIKIPLPQVTDHPGTVLDTIPSDSVIWTEADTLTEAYPYNELKFEHADPNHIYRIAFFIPFDFQVPEPLDSLIKDVKSVTRRTRIIERYRNEEKNPQSVNYLEFFQGSLMAIDSLQKTGMKMDLRFYDTRKSMDHTLSLLMEDDLEDFDLFIGPFYPFNLEIVAAFASKYQIPVVTPFYNESDLVRNNPYLFQLSPSIETEYMEAAKLVASKHMYNIVYVRDEDSLNIEKHNYFKELIFDAFEDYHPDEPVTFKEVVQKLDHSDEIIHSLSKDKKNLVVVPTRNEALASRVVSTLFYQLKEFDIEVMGSPFWTEFSSIELRYYHDLGLIFYSSFWVDYLDPDVNEFMSTYRSLFFNEPQATTRKGINFGIIGYDMTFYFANALRLEGARFILSLEDYHPDLVQDSLKFNRVTGLGGYENNRISFYQFSSDMSIHRIEVPQLPARRLFFRPLEDVNRRNFLYKEGDFE